METEIKTTWVEAILLVNHLHVNVALRVEKKNDKV